MSEEKPYYETAKRMPLEADAVKGAVLAWYDNGGNKDETWDRTPLKEITSRPRLFPFWMPLPPTPVPPKTECERAFEAKHGPAHKRTAGEFQWFLEGWEARKEQP